MYLSIKDEDEMKKKGLVVINKLFKNNTQTRL